VHTCPKTFGYLLSSAVQPNSDFSYASLDPETATAARNAADRIRTQILDNIVEIGRDLLAVKARMHPQGGETELIEAINRVEASLHAAFPQVRWIFFEPDLSD